MKNITITITEELDAAAAAEARRRGLSKSELIRLSLASVLTGKTARTSCNAWLELAGFANPGLSVDTGEIDDTVYGS
jgi:hypothetical protein